MSRSKAKRAGGWCKPDLQRYESRLGALRYYATISLR